MEIRDLKRLGQLQMALRKAIANVFATRFFHPILEQIVAASHETNGFVLCARQNMTRNCLVSTRRPYRRVLSSTSWIYSLPFATPQSGHPP